MARYSSRLAALVNGLYLISAIGVTMAPGSRFMTVYAVGSEQISSVPVVHQKRLSIAKVTTSMVHDAVGFDKAKHIKGRKRHTAVDTLGLVLRVVVTAASVPERVGGQQVLQKVHQIGDAVSRLYLIWVDGGYSGNPFLQWAMDMFGRVIQVVLRPEQTKGFVVLKKRWVVEPTKGWLNWSGRLSKDYERLPASSEAMIYISMIRLMVRRLA